MLMQLWNTHLKNKEKLKEKKKKTRSTYRIDFINITLDLGYNVQLFCVYCFSEFMPVSLKWLQGDFFSCTKQYIMIS